MILTTAVCLSFGCNGSNERPVLEEHLEGGLGETLTNQYFAVKLERVVEELEVSPYSPNVGQRNRIFHVLVLNNSAETQDFDRVVLITVGRDGVKHTYTHQGGLRNGVEPIPFQLKGGAAMRIRSTVPEHAIEHVSAFVVGFAKGDQSLGNPLTFRLENAAFEKDPLLARIEATSSASPLRAEKSEPKEVAPKVVGRWDEELSNFIWAAKVESISRRQGTPNIMHPELTGTEVVFHIVVFNRGDRPFSFSKHVAKTIGGEREFTFAVGSDEASDAVELEPGQGFRSDVTASEVIVPDMRRLEIELTFAKKPVGEKLTFDLENAQGTDEEGLSFPVGVLEDPQARDQERTRQILKRIRRGEHPIEGQFTLNANSLDLLRGALEDSSPHSRRGAAFLLGEIGKDAAPVIPNLIKAFDDPDHGVRLASVEAVGKIGSKDSIPALEKLTATITADNYLIPFAAASGIARSGGEVAGGYDILLAEFKSDDKKTASFDFRKYVAAREIGKSNVSSVVDELISDESEVCQVGACVAICFRNSITPHQFEWLVERTKNGSEMVRIISLIALVGFREKVDRQTADELWEATRNVFRDGERFDGLIGLLLLSNAPRRHTALRERLVELAVEELLASVPMSNSQFLMSIDAAHFLRGLRDPKSILILAEKLKEATEPQHRALIILAMGQGPQAAFVLPLIAPELSDPTSLSWYWTVETIESMNGAAKPVVPAARKLLHQLRSNQRFSFQSDFLQVKPGRLQEMIDHIESFDD